MTEQPTPCPATGCQWHDGGDDAGAGPTACPSPPPTLPGTDTVDLDHPTIPPGCLIRGLILGTEALLANPHPPGSIN